MGWSIFTTKMQGPQFIKQLNGKRQLKNIWIKLVSAFVIFTF